CGIEKKEQALDQIGIASRRLLGVISDVLDINKIEANKFEPFLRNGVFRSGFTASKTPSYQKF
ncbi:MAG: hypothetical protein LBG05_10630, partial [Treponema sp.]|nr:hypothetical protein [Treponema sp.]